MNSRQIRENADRLLYERGLLELLKPLGKPHVIGSYRMDMMAWNDLDIDIENEMMGRDKLFHLTSSILDAFAPSWYEAKEEVSDDGKTVWFHGFETTVNGELWNVDLWFFDRETIAKAERYCDGISQTASAAQKEHIITIKRDLIEKGLYSFEKFHSVDVYRAVLEMGVKNTDEFLERYKK